MSSERKPYYMTDTMPEWVKAQAERTRRVRETFEKIAKNFEAITNVLNPDAKAAEALAKEFQSSYRACLNALVKANEEEAKLATECEKISGIIQGDALDLAEARDEILGRIARLRERG